MNNKPVSEIHFPSITQTLEQMYHAKVHLTLYSIFDANDN